VDNQTIKVNASTNKMSVDPVALIDGLTNDGDFAVDANYVHTDNNYTTADKSKLAGIEDGAQANDIEHVKLGGTELAIVDKTVNVGVGDGLRTSDGAIHARSYYTYETVGDTEYLTHVMEIEED
jgi:hypothetical protein